MIGSFDRMPRAGPSKVQTFAGWLLCLVVVLTLPASGRAQNSFSVPARVDHAERFTRDAPGDKVLHLVASFKRKATQTEYEDLARWLESQGFTLTPGNSEDYTIAFSGDVATSEHAFSVRIRTTNNPEEWGAVDHPKLPARFKTLVSTIDGFYPSSDRHMGPHPMNPSPAGP